MLCRAGADAAARLEGSGVLGPMAVSGDAWTAACEKAGSAQTAVAALAASESFRFVDAETRECRHLTDARLERALVPPLAIDAAIAGSHADDAIPVEEDVRPGKSGEHVHAFRLDQRREPPAQTTHCEHRVPVIPERRRRDWQRVLPARIRR